MSTLIIVVSCVFFVVVLIMLYYGWRKQNKTLPSSLPERAIEWNAACTESQAADSIFVALTSYKDTVSLAETLYSLFVCAQCPKRVIVGILSHGVEKHEEQILAAYADICALRGSPQLLGNIAVRCCAVEHALGPVEARTKLFQELYRPTRFVLLVHSHTQFYAHWDETLIKSFHGSDSNLKRVITTILPSTDAVISLTTPVAPALTFPCMVPPRNSTDFMLPIFQPRVARGPPRLKTVPVVAASSQLLFGLAADLVPVFHSDKECFLPFFNKDIQELYLSLALWSAGCRFFGPLAPVGYHINSLPLSDTIGQRPVSNHGSHQIRSHATQMLATSIVLQLAKEQALVAKSDPKLWLDVFLERPFRNVAASGVAPAITAQTEKYIADAIEKATLPKQVATRFEQSMKTADNVIKVSGSVHERMLSAFQAKMPASQDVINTLSIAQSVKINPTIAKIFPFGKQTLRSFFDFSGYDWINHKMAGHCILGLCQGADKDQILARYNTMALFDSERLKWCYQ